MLHRIYHGTLSTVHSRSSSVSDVLLNVLGIAFVSDLEDLIFRLGTQGYLEDNVKNPTFKKLTTEIEHCDFVRAKKSCSKKALLQMVLCQ